MPTEENKALARRCIDLWNERDAEAAGELYAPDHVYHGSSGELRGREAITGLWAALLAGFPDMHATVDDLIAEGDKVVVRWTIRGAHTGDFHGIAPTDRQVTIPLLEESRIAGGVLAETWGSFDQLGSQALSGFGTDSRR